MRDGNLEAVSQLKSPYETGFSLPMRDGNPTSGRQPITYYEGFSLPMRDGNSVRQRR